MAFFPCIHFCGISQTYFSLGCKNYKNWDYRRRFEYLIDKSNKRTEFFNLLNKLICVCLERDLRIVLENPWEGQQFLRVFLKQPDIIDNNRMLRGDYMIKPTAYWFWNCTPSRCKTYQNDKERIEPMWLPKGKKAGICSKERSMISHDYARNFIADFILGKPLSDRPQQQTLF